jgi:hypothetical protein
MRSRTGLSRTTSHLQPSARATAGGLGSTRGHGARVVRVGLLGALFSLCGCFVACDNQPPLLRCGALPDPSACPSTRGGTCDDKTCDSLYTCTEEGWVFVARCDGGGEPGGAGGAGGDSAAGAGGEPLCGQAEREFVCIPLQPPDCDEANARACPTQACIGACDVFFRCTADGWAEDVVGYCDDDGELVLSDPAP